MVSTDGLALADAELDGDLELDGDIDGETE
jgi:hypothetical protein